METRENKRRRSLTLVEALVVIAIIATLVLPFPLTWFYLVLKNTVQRSVCTSQVHQVAVAAQMYAQDNDGAYPATGVGTAGLQEYAITPAFRCVATGHPYLLNRELSVETEADAPIVADDAENHGPLVGFSDGHIEQRSVPACFRTAVSDARRRGEGAGP